MMKRVIAPLFAVVTAAVLAAPAQAMDRDGKFFHSVEGQWAGPGEIVAGKYKGTKFTCNLSGTTPDGGVGVTLDGSCRVGLFSQQMTASVVRTRGHYKGSFLDGAKGKGIDIVSGSVDGSRVVLGLSRHKLRGAMLAHLSNADTMNVTISVRVEDQMVPVIGMNLKRIDGHATASVNERLSRN